MHIAAYSVFIAAKKRNFRHRFGAENRLEAYFD